MKGGRKHAAAAKRPKLHGVESNAVEIPARLVDWTPYNQLQRPQERHYIRLFTPRFLNLLSTNFTVGQGLGLHLQFHFRINLNLPTRYRDRPPRRVTHVEAARREPRPRGIVKTRLAGRKSREFVCGWLRHSGVCLLLSADRKLRMAERCAPFSWRAGERSSGMVAHALQFTS
jgi:hypothetical protein